MLERYIEGPSKATREKIKQLGVENGLYKRKESYPNFMIPRTWEHTVTGYVLSIVAIAGAYTAQIKNLPCLPFAILAVAVPTVDLWMLPLADYTHTDVNHRNWKQSRMIKEHPQLYAGFKQVKKEVEDEIILQSEKNKEIQDQIYALRAKKA